MRLRPGFTPRLLAIGLAAGSAPAQVLTGQAAMGDWKADAPGVVRRLTAADLPPVSAPTALPASVVARPAGASPRTLPGLAVAAFAEVPHARQIRVAPGGDIFVAQSDAGAITVLRAADGAKAPSKTAVFAKGLELPFGMAFYPAGPDPRWLYVGEVNRIVRFAYRNGDLEARGEPETVVASLTDGVGGHVTRDLEFSKDGRRLLVAVGSGSNVAQEMPAKTVAEAKAWDLAQPGAGPGGHPAGAGWGPEAHRADVLAFDPDGGRETILATGLRNCVTLRIEPVSGAPWCVVNERDSLGDDTPFDYATRVRPGAFYGWPWFYIGDHKDGRPNGARPDLAADVSVPDVFFQAHSAPLGLVFYARSAGPAALPAIYDGDAFVTLHGSWNRSARTGYKLVGLKFHNGVPDGTYEDILTGFVVDARHVWGRPVGVAEAHDGALLVTDDAGGVVWRIAPAGK